MSKQTRSVPFIDYLWSLVEKGDRGALADLRKGLGKPIASDIKSYRYIAPWISENDHGTWKEKVNYIVAPLFAYYQSGSTSDKSDRHAVMGNLGDHLREAGKEEKNTDSIERRFIALISAHADDLPIYLKQIISILKSKNVEINWEQLYSDLLNWNRPSQSTQKNWAYSYWGSQALETTNPPSGGVPFIENNQGD